MVLSRIAITAMYKYNASAASCVASLHYSVSYKQLMHRSRFRGCKQQAPPAAIISEGEKEQNRTSLKNSAAALVYSGTARPSVRLASCVGQTNLLGSKPVVPVSGLGRFLLLFQIMVEGGIQGLQTAYHSVWSVCCHLHGRTIHGSMRLWMWDSNNAVIGSARNVYRPESWALLAEIFHVLHQAVPIPL